MLRRLLAGLVLLLVLAPLVHAQEWPISWKPLQPGVELAAIELAGQPGPSDRKLFVVRVDLARAKLKAVLASERDKAPRIAGDWCRAEGLSVAINLGMFRSDQITNVGYLRNGTHENNPRWASRYQTALGFGARRSGLPSAIMVDLDQPGAKEQLESYETVVQNLRLIKASGQNAWESQEKRWSEAAVAMDREGRLLFIFTRTPLSMWEFNRTLLALPLHIERAMHVDGGSEASLSIHVAGIDLDLFGNVRSELVGQDLSLAPWPIPNVLGVVKSGK